MKKIFSRIVQHKFIVVIAILLVGGAFYYGYKKANTSVETNSQPVFATASKKDISVSVTGTGQIYSKSQVDLKPQVAGDGIDVLKVAVKNDQEVKEGDLIAVLDYSDAQKSVRNAELELESAKLKYESVKEDYKDDKINSYDKKTQKLTVTQKENSLADAKENLSEYYIKAPFSGVVTGLSVEAGSSVSRTDILASVITSDMYAKVSLNEVDAVSVEVGDDATLTFDAIEGLKIKGKVTKIDTIGTVEQGVVYYEAEITFENGEEKLKSGMSVSVDIITESRIGALSIPASAVKTGDFGEYVQIVEEPEGAVSDEGNSQNIYYKEKSVKTGISDGVNVEIVSGLVEGDKIIVKAASASSKSSATTSTEGGLLNSVRIPGTGGGMGR